MTGCANKKDRLSLFRSFGLFVSVTRVFGMRPGLAGFIEVRGYFDPAPTGTGGKPSRTGTGGQCALS